VSGFSMVFVIVFRAVALTCAPNAFKAEKERFHAGLQR